MKKNMLLLLLLASLTLLALGCKKNHESMTVKAADLLDHHFVLIKADGKDYKLNKIVSLDFYEGMNISGAICNRFTGKAELRGVAPVVLQSKNLASTRMFCPEKELNELEANFSSMLSEGAEVRLEGENLTLSTPKHTMVYQKRDRMAR